MNCSCIGWSNLFRIPQVAVAAVAGNDICSCTRYQYLSFQLKWAFHAQQAVWALHPSTRDCFESTKLILLYKSWWQPFITIHSIRTRNCLSSQAVKRTKIFSISRFEHIIKGLKARQLLNMWLVATVRLHPKFSLPLQLYKKLIRTGSDVWKKSHAR